MPSQEEEYDRVERKLRLPLWHFWHENTDRRFHMDDLIIFARAIVPNVASDSVSRIFRGLRQGHTINYEVVSRSNSYYHMLPLGRIPRRPMR